VIVYVRPLPFSSRSARRRKLSSSTTTTSFVVFPSLPPGALSGSLEVADTSDTSGAGSKSSSAAMVAWTSTYLWLGGNSRSGDTETSIAGAISSHMSSPTTTAS
jgi:hypothetical protein